MSKEKESRTDVVSNCNNCTNIEWIKKDFAFHNPRKLTQEEKDSLSTLSDEDKVKLYNETFGTTIEEPTENVLKQINNKLNLLASYEN